MELVPPSEVYTHHPVNSRNAEQSARHKPIQLVTLMTESMTAALLRRRDHGRDRGGIGSIFS